MAQYTYHKADTRGHDYLGWLDSKKTFSFGEYYNPKRMGFGALRVLNDDIVEGGKGFGEHPHDNMEIVSIALEGGLEHKDSMGNVKVLLEGQVQVMSTGSGIFHSEYNHYADRPAAFLQIWLYPNQLNITPRYTQLSPEKGQNTLLPIISPDNIQQDAWFYSGVFEKDIQTAYRLQKPGNGIYAFVIKGSFTIDGKTLQTRDGMGIQEIDVVHITSLEDNGEILLMDIPMDI
ncbi:pirin family protein [Chitinophaga vietnamensis]|uniref:pirin family protein n=1 Tax=Chitinophaga vietnamensis TaxID=2593957 RepID=UPI001177B11B|nr:pirin family protein [Chitinophaga vietnamensis]